MARGLTLGIILLLGGGWRILEATARWRDPLPFGDEHQYFAMGLGLRDGELLAETARPWRPTARRAPLYPALISFAAGPEDSPGRVRGLNAFLAILTILLAYALAAQAHSALAGLAAAGLVAANGALAAWSGTVFIETAYGFLILLAAAALAEWSRRHDERSSAALGLAAGASLLCRSNLFAVPVAAAAWLLRRQGRAGGRAAVLLLACATLPLAPWALRNALQFGRFIPLDDRAVTPLTYLASAGAVRAAPHRTFSVESTPLLEAQQRELAGAGDVEELYDRMEALTRRNLLREPLVFLKAWAARLAVALATLARLLPWPCALLLVVGLGLLRGPPWGSLYALGGYFVFLYSLVAFQDRYLLPVLPLALVLAGAAAAELAGRVGGVGLAAESGGLERTALAVPAAAAALACALCFVRLARESGKPRAVAAREWADRGWESLREGRPAEAEGFFDRAAAAASAWPEPYLGRAVANARLGGGRAGADVNEAIGRLYRPWSGHMDDLTASWAAAAFEARAGWLEKRGRKRAAAADALRARRLRGAVDSGWEKK